MRVKTVFRVGRGRQKLKNKNRKTQFCCFCGWSLSLSLITHFASRGWGSWTHNPLIQPHCPMGVSYIPLYGSRTGRVYWIVCVHALLTVELPGLMVNKTAAKRMFNNLDKNAANQMSLFGIKSKITLFYAQTQQDFFFYKISTLIYW